MRVIRTLLFAIIAGLCFNLCAKETKELNPLDKSKLLIYLINHIIWPEEVSDNKINLCFANSNRLKEYEDILINKLKQKKFSFKLLSEFDNIMVSECKILHLDGISRNMIENIIDNIKLKPILTISEIEDYTKYGCGAWLHLANTKPAITLNIESVTNHGLQLTKGTLDKFSIIPDADDLKILDQY